MEKIEELYMNICNEYIEEPFNAFYMMYISKFKISLCFYDYTKFITISHLRR